MGFPEILQLAISSLTLVAIIITAYRFLHDPDVNNTSSIREMGIACDYRHKAIDGDIALIKETMTLLKVNHINHIEKDMREMRDKQTKILTILEAKYQVKVEN